MYETFVKIIVDNTFYLLVTELGMRQMFFFKFQIIVSSCGNWITSSATILNTNDTHLLVHTLHFQIVAQHMLLKRILHTVIHRVIIVNCLRHISVSVITIFILIAKSLTSVDHDRPRINSVSLCWTAAIPIDLLRNGDVTTCGSVDMVAAPEYMLNC